MMDWDQRREIGRRKINRLDRERASSMDMSKHWSRILSVEMPTVLEKKETLISALHLDCALFIIQSRCYNRRN